MFRTRPLKYGIGLLFLIAGICSAAQQETTAPSTSELMAAAHKAGDLGKLEPYTLKANITTPSKPKEKGTLVIYRDHEKQRIDIDLGGYRETRLVLGDQEYVRPQHALVDAVKLVNFDRSWDPTQRINPQWETRADLWSDPSRRKVLNHDVWCVERMTRYGQSTLCFDAQNSVLLERTDPKVAVDFRSYDQLDQLFAPTAAIIKPEHLEEIDLSDMKITPGAIPSNIWGPTSDALEVRRCQIDFLPPRPKSMPEPYYPEAARRQNKQGVVVFYAVITSNGKVAMPQTLSKDPYGLTDAARAAVKRWKLIPGTCAGQAVNTLMELQVEFNLSQGRP